MVLVPVRCRVCKEVFAPLDLLWASVKCSCVNKMGSLQGFDGAWLSSLLDYSHLKVNSKFQHTLRSVEQSCELAPSYEQPNCSFSHSMAHCNLIKNISEFFFLSVCMTSEYFAILIPYKQILHRVLRKKPLKLSF